MRPVQGFAKLKVVDSSFGNHGWSGGGGIFQD